MMKWFWGVLLIIALVCSNLVFATDDTPYIEYLSNDFKTIYAGSTFYPA